MSDRFVSDDLLLAATNFTEPWVHTAVLRGPSLLQDASNPYGLAFRTCMTSFKIRATINSLASTSDSRRGIVHTTLVLLSRMFFAENTPVAANIYNFCGDNMPSLNLHFTIGSDPTTTGFSVRFQLRSNFLLPRLGSKANGSTCYVRI